MRRKNLSQKKQERNIHHNWSRLGHSSFSYCFWILFANVVLLINLKFLVQQKGLKWRILNKRERLFRSSRVNFLLVNMFANWFWDQCNGSVFCPNWSCQTNPEQLCGSVHSGSSTFDNQFDYRLSSMIYNIALEPEFVVFDGMWSMFVLLTLVCLIGMGLCMFDLTTADGFLKWLSLGSICSIWYGMTTLNHQMPESESGNAVHA